MTASLVFNQQQYSSSDVERRAPAPQAASNAPAFAR